MAAYNDAWKITDIFPVNVLGFQTHRDHFAVGFDRQDMENRFAEMRSEQVQDDDLRERYKLRDNRDWNLADARKAIRSNENWRDLLVNCLYRPYDYRTCYFSEVAMDYPRREIRQHVLAKDNICLAEPWIDSLSPTGSLALTVLETLANLDRNFKRIAAANGRFESKSKGIHLGRNPKLTVGQQQEIIARCEAGESPAAIARSFGVSRTTVSRLLRQK